MVRFLSDEWLARLDEAADRAAAEHGPVETDDVVIEQVVEEGPDGAVTYHLCLIDGRLRIRAGQAGDPTVTLRQDHATAVAIARGELSAQRAFLAGRLRIGGDLRSLVGAQRALAAYDDALAPVRAATTY